MRPVRKVDNLTTILCRCQEIWNLKFLEPSGTLQASNGNPLPFYYGVSSITRQFLPIYNAYLQIHFVVALPG
jgi:hypothetical protein